MPKLRLIVSVAEGELTLRDIQIHRSSVLEHPLHDERFGLLFDMRRVTEFDMQTSDLRMHANEGIVSGRRYSRVAFIAPRDLAFGLARMYEVYVGKQYGEESVRVFRQPQDAWLWLRRSLAEDQSAR